MKNKSKLKINVNIKKQHIFLLSGCVLLVVAAITAAFMTDYKRADNVFAVGSVSLTVTEPNFPTESSELVMYSGKTIPKDPKIINNGNNKEYVFMSVTVPKRKVTLLSENGTKTSAGTDVDTAPTDYSEIFYLFSDSATAVSDPTNCPNIKYEPSWAFVSSSGTENTSDKATYVFGYKKMLNTFSDNSGFDTTPLFNKVRLNSFIEGENSSDDKTRDIVIKAYGVQADNIRGIESLPTDNTTELTAEQMIYVYNIIINQTTEGTP